MMTPLHIVVVAHTAAKLILPYISCLLFKKVKSLAYVSIGHLRSKICFIVINFSFFRYDTVTEVPWKEIF